MADVDFASPAEMEVGHFINTVAGLRKKNRALQRTHHTKAPFKDRPMLGGDGGADSPSATIVSSAAARRQPIIPRPATAGSTPWALRPQPEGEFVPSRLSRRIHVARLQKEWTVEDLAKAVQVEPGMIARFESGEDYPRERSVLEALQTALGEEDSPLQLAASPRTGKPRTATPAKNRSGRWELAHPKGTPIAAAGEGQLLNRSFAQLDDKGAAALAAEVLTAGMAALRVDRNQIGDEGAAALAAAVEKAGLSSLDISHNALGSKGVQALCAAGGWRR